MDQNIYFLNHPQFISAFGISSFVRCFAWAKLQCTWQTVEFLVFIKQNS